jgi:regulator of replication initiation timing
MDDRLVQRLEEQLSDAYANNGQLRERLAELQKDADAGRAFAGEAAGLKLRLEAAENKRRAAEDNSAAAQRKQQEAERSLMRVQEDNDQLAADLERARSESGRLAELNAKVEQAKSLDDLVSS